MAREYANFWQADDLNGMELLHARYITHRFDRHIHPGYAIGVIEWGAEGFYYRGVQAETAPVGSIVAINPGEIHTGYALTPGGWCYRMFYPGIDFMQTVAYELTGRECGTPHFAAPIIHDADLRDRFLRLHRILQTSDDALVRESAARDAFGLMLMRHSRTFTSPRRTGDERDVVRKVRDYIDAHLAENTSLNELAAYVAMSPYHLLRVFRQEMGIPPHTYRIQQRIIHAKALLAAGVPIVDVAAATGFTDQSHFTNRFKAIVGVTPGIYSSSI